MAIIKKLKISEIKDLLSKGKKVKVKTLNNKFVDIKTYIEKGTQDTYQVVLDNGFSIKVSKSHRFFSSFGWSKTLDLIPGSSSLLCDDNQFHKVQDIKFVGKYNIVDIEVDDEEHCYFGNHILNHNSGKSLLTYHILSNTQKMGGIGVYLDIERSMSRSFMERMGVDSTTLITPKVPPYDIESLFDYILKIVLLTKEKFPKKDKLVTIVIDSVAALQSREEVERDNEEVAKIGSEARSWSRGLRKNISILDEDYVTIVFTNQLRDKMGITNPFAEKTTTPGGKAIPFYASTRIKLSSLGKIKDKDGVIVGVDTSAKVIKNRVGPGYRIAEFPLLFSWGIQDSNSILTFLFEKGVVTGSAHKTLKLYDKEFTFKNSDWENEYKGNAELNSVVQRYLEKELVVKFERAPSMDALEIQPGKDGLEE